MTVKSESEVAQLCPTLSDPMDCSLPGSSIHGIFQARVLEWGAIAFSKDFCIVNKTEVDVFLELSCFFDDPVDVGNLISSSSAFRKTSLNIWKFTVHVLLKPDAKSLQSCLTLCDPIDGSPPGSAVPGILQARTLEWVAISFSNA